MKSISLTICHIILKHLLECWCNYGKCRAKTQPDIHTALSTLQDLQRQSLSYSFPIRTQKWFLVDYDQLSKLDALAIDDRIKHAKTLLSTASSLNMRVNTITNYFSSSSNQSTTPINVQHVLTNTPSHSITAPSSTHHNPPHRIESSLTSYSPYKYIHNKRRTNTQSMNDVKIIRIRRNKYRKFCLYRPMYVKSPKNQRKSHIATQYSTNKGKKRPRDNNKSTRQTDNCKKLCKYVPIRTHTVKNSLVRRKRDSYVEPAHRKIKKM